MCVRHACASMCVYARVYTYIYLCVCICVYVSEYVCVSLNIHMCISVCRQTGKQIRKLNTNRYMVRHVYIYACIHTRICFPRSSQLLGLFVCIFVCMFVCMFVCAYSCVYVCMCMYVWMQIRMHACMHACSYTCTQVCTYARTYTRLHSSITRDDPKFQTAFLTDKLPRRAWLAVECSLKLAIAYATFLAVGRLTSNIHMYIHIIYIFVRTM